VVLCAKNCDSPQNAETKNLSLGGALRTVLSVDIDGVDRVCVQMMVNVNGEQIKCLFGDRFTYCVCADDIGMQVPYFVFKTGIEREDCALDVGHDTRVVKPVDDILAANKLELDQQQIVSPCSPTSVHQI